MSTEPDTPLYETKIVFYAADAEEAGLALERMLDALCGHTEDGGCANEKCLLGYAVGPSLVEGD